MGLVNMRNRSVILIPLVVILLVGIGYGVASGRGHRPRMFYSGDIHGSRPAPDCLQLDPPCPVVLAPATLQTTWQEDAISFDFELPIGSVPEIDAAQAVNIAR